MSGVTGKPRQTRLHVLLLAVKSHKKRLGCGHIVDTLTTISTLQRVSQTVRVARNVTDEVNAYEEDIERVVGIYAPHLGSELVRVTRTAEWRIVPKLLAVELLTLKSGIAAPRSPVNNCGIVSQEIQAFQIEKTSDRSQDISGNEQSCEKGRLHRVLSIGLLSRPSDTYQKI